MHEWALAEAVIEAAVADARKEGMTEITEITVRIGELQQIELDPFTFALDEITKMHGKLLQNAQVKLEDEPAIFTCRVCGTEWRYQKASLNEAEGEAIHFAPEVAHAYMRCPSCKSPDFEVVQGRGVTIQRIKGLK
ncbi:MAG: hydrogenase nickel incorporation protein HypA [Candidatus Methanospirareceae archaeon]